MSFIASGIPSLLAGVLVLCVAAPAAAQTAPRPGAPVPAAMAAADSTVSTDVGVMRPGDELNLIVYRDAELTGKFLVDGYGNVQIPGLGVIAVAGSTPAEVSERIRAQLVRRGTIDPEIAVQPMFRVSALGEVRNPGLLSIVPGTNVVQLLTLAGGPTERAKLGKSRLVREGRSLPMDLGQALAGAPEGQRVLFSNDVLVVPRDNSLLRRENFGLFVNAVTLLTSLVNLYLIARN